jgi:RNA polymerase sigma factor (sigma-70 family)
MELQSFVEAVRSQQPAEIERWSREAREVLINYLRSRFGANTDDAEDCVQETLLLVMTRVNEGKFDAKKPGGYVITMLRNLYIKKAREQARLVEDDKLEDYYLAEDYDPVERLASEEMKAFLYECIRQLTAISQRMIRYFLKHPDVRIAEVAELFNTTESSVWVRRYRINNKLLKCIQKKM